MVDLTNLKSEIMEALAELEEQSIESGSSLLPESLHLNDIYDEITDNDVDKLKEKREKEQDKYNKMEEDHQDNLLSSRTFALSLIGIASFYILVMICQGYK